MTMPQGYETVENAAIKAGANSSTVRSAGYAKRVRSQYAQLKVTGVRELVVHIADVMDMYGPLGPEWEAAAVIAHRNNIGVSELLGIASHCHALTKRKNNKTMLRQADISPYLNPQRRAESKSKPKVDLDTLKNSQKDIQLLSGMGYTAKQIANELEMNAEHVGRVIRKPPVKTRHPMFRLKNMIWERYKVLGYLTSKDRKMVDIANALVEHINLLKEKLGETDKEPLLDISGMNKPIEYI